MTAPARPGAAPLPWSRYSQLPESERRAAETACRELTEEIHRGLDLGPEIRTVAVRGLGDTLLLADRTSRLAGFAICHWGPASEAGTGCA